MACWRWGGGVGVVVVWAAVVEVFVWADRVVESAVGSDAGVEVDAVDREVAVEVFVFQRAVEALDDAVGARRQLRLVRSVSSELFV